jgi:hypothetical protein
MLHAMNISWPASVAMAPAVWISSPIAAMALEGIYHPLQKPLPGVAEPFTTVDAAAFRNVRSSMSTSCVTRRGPVQARCPTHRHHRALPSANAVVIMTEQLCAIGSKAPRTQMIKL